MTINCLNCNAELNGQFCSNCGQSSDTHTINLHYLWHDIQHGLLHVDKGILFTIKELFTRPGNSIREFLQGKRVNHFKPISLIIILAGVYSLLSHYFGLNLLTNYYKIDGNEKEINQLRTIVNDISEWLSLHYAILALLQIPVFSLGTYLCFKKSGYNFIEHFIINSFIAAQKLTLHIVAFPFYYLSVKTTYSQLPDQITDGIGLVIFIWTIFQLFNYDSPFQRFWRTFLSLVIPYSIFILIAIAGFYFMFHSFK